ncbi:MAG: hypothetical protein HY831_03970 [Candidatus Aenigmarchaeota archaeon]|nr:hypothetical protein [Candidatus Aenigmarchaeota archaeon]
MKERNIIEITDVSKKELEFLIKRVLFFKKNYKNRFSILKGKNVGLLLDSASLRTKLSFEIATFKLGGFPYFIPTRSITHELGKPREDFEDIIETLDKFLDIYIVRDYSRKLLTVLMRKNYPPFINGFSGTGHPSQALADVATIEMHRGNIKKLNIYAICPPNGSGVIESFVYAILLLGGDITLITPKGKITPKNNDFFKTIEKLEGHLNIVKHSNKLIKNADVLYVDEWWENDPKFLDKKPHKKYVVDKEFLKNSKKDMIILHCLPAHHEREISKEVFYSKNSVVFDEVEFRIYSAMALLEFLSK